MLCNGGRRQTYQPSRPRQAVKLPRFDIVRKVNEQALLWLEEAADLESAKSRIRELATVWPEEFDVMDRRSHQTVAKVIDPADDSHKTP
jgi:hypothetical protein